MPKRTQRDERIKAEHRRFAGKIQFLVAHVTSHPEIRNLRESIEQNPCTNPDLGCILSEVNAKRFASLIEMSERDFEEYCESGFTETPHVVELIKVSTSAELVRVAGDLTQHERDCTCCRAQKEHRAAIRRVIKPFMPVFAG